MTHKLELCSVCYQVINNDIGIGRPTSHLSVIVEEFNTGYIGSMERELVQLFQFFSFYFKTINKDCSRTIADCDEVRSSLQASDMTMSCLFIINFILDLSSLEVSKVGDLVTCGYKEHTNDFIILIVYLAYNYA